MEKSKRAALAVVFVALAAAGAYNVYINQGAPVKEELNKALNSDKPVLLYFHSRGCASCIEQEEILDRLESERGGEIAFVRADFAENREMFNEYAGLVSAFPVVVIFNSEGEIVEKYSGVTEKAELERALFS
jgi:thiol-disulfide isomerase/thioredoxin